MPFSRNARAIPNYDVQAKIKENMETVTRAIDGIHSAMRNAAYVNNISDDISRIIQSTIENRNNADFYIDHRIGPCSENQANMIRDIETIEDMAHNRYKMEFVLDLLNQKYFSAREPEDIGTYICGFRVTESSKAVIVQLKDNECIGLFTYIGVPFNNGVAYLYVHGESSSFFVQLQEFYFLSLRKDLERNYYHGLLLSYNCDWGWQNISFAPILKPNQDMVWKLIEDAARSSDSGQQMKFPTYQRNAPYISPWKNNALVMDQR